MTALVDDIRREVVELHEFFTAWFNGTADRTQLEARFISRLHPNLIFIAPDGNLLKTEHLKTGFEQAYGSNPDFRIQIRDVTIRLEFGDQILVTYTEWQIGAKTSELANNARFTTALLKKSDPFQWLHLHETWLPESIRAADPFDF